VITREAAVAVLRLLTSAFPTQRLDDDNVETYLARMTSPPFTHVDVLLEVAQACVDELDRFPTIHQLLIAYQAAARARAATDQQALERAGRAHGRTPQPDAAYGREMIDALHTALAEHSPSASGARGHRHIPGRPPAETCTVCAGAPDVAAAVIQRMGVLLVDRNIVPKPQPVQTYRCRECQDRRFVEVPGAEGTMNVRPCGPCNSDQYEAWVDGRYELRQGW